MSPTRWRASAAATALAILSLLLAACGGASAPSSSGGPAAPAGDFNIVAYQGDAVLGGKQVAFKKVFDQGKPVVLNFWAGLCPPCRAEMPGFQKVYASMQDKVVFVGIDIGPFVQLGSHDDAVKLYKQLGIQYPLAYAIDANPLQIYGIQGMPTTVFFSTKGQVVDQRTGILTEDQLRSIIQQKLLTS